MQHYPHRFQHQEDDQLHHDPVCLWFILYILIYKFIKNQIPVQGELGVRCDCGLRVSVCLHWMLQWQPHRPEFLKSSKPGHPAISRETGTSGSRTSQLMQDHMAAPGMSLSETGKMEAKWILPDAQLLFLWSEYKVPLNYVSVLVYLLTDAENI